MNSKAKLIDFIRNLPTLYPRRFRTKEAQKSEHSYALFWNLLI
ncbi:hypothetical protein [Candidatus Methanoperedens sp. BLZ2]|nr:hypothetical protein [Candidatus Methanoperedens sp. BLZ2]